MTKFKFFLLLLVFSLMFSSCGTDKIEIEDYTWKMRAVMSNELDDGENLDSDSLVLAVGESDALYPDAKIVDITLIAKNGEITLTDETNNKVYGGTYQVTKNTSNAIDYKIKLDGLSGYATVSATEYYSGTEIPTLPINFGEYSVYFCPKAK